MRIQHRYLTFDRNNKLIKLLDQLTVRYKVEEKSYDENTHFYALEFFLYEDNPRFLELTEAVRKFKIEPQISTFYDKEDLSNAEWFIVSAGQYQYPQPEDSYLEKTFDLENYCNLCGIERIQNAPFRLKTEPKQLNNQFWGLHWEYFALFVRQETKNILEKEKIKGIRFTKPVLNTKGVEIDRFYQLHIETVLTNGFDSYNTKKITCKLNNEESCNSDPNSKCCGSIKFHHPKIGGYLFDKSIFNPVNDIVQSNEYFGSGASANRLQIVSKRFKQIVENYKLKGLSFTPVQRHRLIR